MRAPTALAALLLAASFATPAAAGPSVSTAEPACGGPYQRGASCYFSASAGNRVVVRGSAFSTSGAPRVTVAIYLPNGTIPVLTCIGFGVAVATCDDDATVPFTTTYRCRVGGILYGTYSCGYQPL